MRDTTLLKILELLKAMDERILNIESSLGEIDLEGFYLSSYGSDLEAIKEIETKLLIELVKENSQ